MGQKVKDIIQKNPITIEEHGLLSNAKKIMLVNKTNFLIVVQNKNFFGVIKDSEIVEKDEYGITVGDIVRKKSKEDITGHIDMSVKEVAVLIENNNLEVVPILDDNKRLIGIITPTDVAKGANREDEENIAPEKAVIYLSMTQTRKDEKFWFDKIKKMGYRAAVTQIGANRMELAIKLRESAIVASIAKGVIKESDREKNAVSNAVRDLYAQIEIINRGLGGGFKLAIIRGKDIVAVSAFGRCGHALGSGPHQIFMGYSII